MPRKCDSHYHRGCDSLSLSSPMCLSTRTFFFPPKTHFPCFTTFCPYVEILFYRALLLVNFPDDLVARIQHSRCRCPTSDSGHQPKSCLKQQAKATQNQFPINNWTIQAWLQDGESLHWYLIYKKCAIFFPQNERKKYDHFNNTKKAFDKIQHPFMVKTLNKFGTEGTSLKKLKLYRTSPDLILHMWWKEKDWKLSSEIKNKARMPTLNHCYSTQSWKV